MTPENLSLMIVKLPYTARRMGTGGVMADARRGSGLGFLPWLLGAIISTFSIATLIQQGIVIGDLAAPIQALIDAYNERIEWLFHVSGFEAAARAAAQWLAGFFGWHIDLQPHWRHVFLLSMALFLAYARVGVGEGAISYGLSYFLFGFLGSLTGALVAGSVPLGGGARSEAVIFCAPVSALLVAFGLASAAGRGLRLVSLAPVFVVGALMAFLAATASLPFYDRLAGAASPGLALLGLSVIFLALFFLVTGAVSGLSGSSLPLLVRVWSMVNVRVGLIMLSGFAGAALLFTADAALKLPGR